LISRVKSYYADKKTGDVQTSSLKEQINILQPRVAALSRENERLLGENRRLRIESDEKEQLLRADITARDSKISRLSSALSGIKTAHAKLLEEKDENARNHEQKLASAFSEIDALRAELDQFHVIQQKTAKHSRRKFNIERSVAKLVLLDSSTEAKIAHSRSMSDAGVSASDDDFTIRPEDTLYLDNSSSIVGNYRHHHHDTSSTASPFSSHTDIRSECGHGDGASSGLLSIYARLDEPPTVRLNKSAPAAGNFSARNRSDYDDDNDHPRSIDDSSISAYFSYGRTVTGGEPPSAFTSPSLLRENPQPRCNHHSNYRQQRQGSGCNPHILALPELRSKVNGSHVEPNTSYVNTSSMQAPSPSLLRPSPLASPTSRPPISARQEKQPSAQNDKGPAFINNHHLHYRPTHINQMAKALMMYESDSSNSSLSARNKQESSIIDSTYGKQSSEASGRGGRGKDLTAVASARSIFNSSRGNDSKNESRPITGNIIHKTSNESIKQKPASLLSAARRKFFRAENHPQQHHDI
jgi:hypothetical protein